ncbi:hypothetical protein BC835DRAFT_1417763 [Cytidiella melzeri]|nr:hypothetical protein BC835DRAFT_1417763 [Cytidiella melzeri]
MSTTVTEGFVYFLDHLRLLLDPKNLPQQLPLVNKINSKYAVFINFQVDAELLAHMEDEVGTVSMAAEQLYATYGLQMPVPSRAAQKRHRASSTAVHDPDPMLIVDSGSSDDGLSTGNVHLGLAKGKGVLKLKGTGKGRPPNKLMNSAIIKHDTSRPGHKSQCHWECISPKCSYSASGDPVAKRVFLHAATCTQLQETQPDIHRQIVDTQSALSLGARLQDTTAKAAASQLTIPHAIVRSASDSALRSSGSRSNLTPPTHKKIRLEGNASVLENYVAQGTKAHRKDERAALQQQADHAITRLICARGLVPNIVDSPEWKELMGILNPGYTPSSSDKFYREYIPQEAGFVRREQLKELSQHHNLTITFDRNSTRRDTIYFVHATTLDRVHYFVDGHVGTSEHHTVPWVKSKILKYSKWSIHEIGVEKIAATCSDSTIVTLKTRAEITQEIPTIVDLRDCCHHLHGIIGKITKLPRFVAPLANLKKIVAHFSKSTFSKAMLQLEDSDGHKLSALQKIGNVMDGLTSP